MKYGEFDTTAVINMELIDICVRYDFEQGEPEVYSLSNGDPGHPGTPDQVYLTYAEDEQGEDRLHDLSKEDHNRIIEEILTDQQNG